MILDAGDVVLRPYDEVRDHEPLITRAVDSLRLPRVLAACSPLNAASEHVLRDKLKMRFECEVEIKPGFRRDRRARAAKTPTGRPIAVADALNSFFERVADEHHRTWGIRGGHRGMR